ncbi:hypothetical protein K388_02793 [Streptomyces sp. KhCrAH-43]|uniref:hypothetical protein n=1 Tax=unclassified Streptomyces TaxID=2593676 RepID=UPI00036C0A0F|nr:MULTISPECIES: hypothetical protein [unclassified Streptomyces]MYS36783.1 hypothetical protein [Streptomyces sp. SID4920]MYX69254.1 hypothetical protein [Streptomyces sp. SID8373]RAJ62107.1 hypothetical protein K388_02793 [Streptomyces sp. KhCrAH-43]
MTQSDGEPAFSELLERLWQSKRHPTGRVYTYPEVSQGILDRTGFKITTSGLQQLRTGVNLNPKWYTVKGLAIFFEVDTDYFLGADEPAGDADEGSELQGAEERVRAAMRDRGVLRVALRANGLDEASLRMVEVVLDQTRRLQGLPEADLSDLLDDEYE